VRNRGLKKGELDGCENCKPSSLKLRRDWNAGWLRASAVWAGWSGKRGDGLLEWAKKTQPTTKLPTAAIVTHMWIKNFDIFIGSYKKAHA
jgi:hypothetical protein